MISFILHICFLLLAFGCSSSDDHPLPAVQEGEYIYRMHDESLFEVPLPEKTIRDPYPWEQSGASGAFKITKDFFRCKGSLLNPPRILEEKGEAIRYYDCGGAEKHSLPLKNNQEFIYQILIDILNDIQKKTQKKVVITSGHRCPEHNAYVDPSPENRASKHLLGAEVSFYVQGLENSPETVVDLVQHYYRQHPQYREKKEFEFKRYEKANVNVSTQPWCNKEIFIKLFKADEGRNFDNRHPYPYISIQVRYDIEKNEPVNYSWDKAYRNYFRK